MAGTIPAAKLIALVEALGELKTKETAILEEISTLLGGGVGIGAQMKAGYAAFAEQWAVRYPGPPYLWIWKKDGPQMKRLVLALGVDELNARAWRYISNPDPWLIKNRHPFGVFVSQVNQYAAETKRPMAAAGDDEADKTQRRLRELRDGGPF